MNINLKSDSNLPIYEQIVEEIKRGILSGEIRPREMLPSIRSLARGLEISVITTKRAYEELEKAGLIYSAVGKGFYVKEPDKARMREEELRKFETEAADLIQHAKHLGLEEEEVIALVQMLYEGGEGE